MRFTQEKLFLFIIKRRTYKNEEFNEINVRNKRKEMLELQGISIQKAYKSPFGLSSNNKKDLKEFVLKKLIDPYHVAYFESMLICNSCMNVIFDRSIDRLKSLLDFLLSQQELFDDYEMKANEKTDTEYSDENQRMRRKKRHYDDRSAEEVVLRGRET